MSTLKRKGESLTNGVDSKKPKANGSIASFFSAPKPAGGTVSTPASPSVKFDKQKWLAGLTAEQKQLLKLEIDTLHDSWLALLKDDITSKEFLELKKFLDRETNAGRKWFPPKEDVYSWSRHTPFHNVKVVIVGQDPYHNDRQAHGLAFSVRPPTPAPPSLKNMYIALKKDYPTFVPPPNRGGLLTPWADRGVLMLNTCLTVRAHEANSHSNRGWERFTQKIIDLVAQKRTRGVVFMAWGTPAGKRVQKVDKQRHLILQSVHPSPLSASRGFFDCGHFKKANEWLIKRYGDEGEIDWALSPGVTTKAVAAAVAGASLNGTESVKVEVKEEGKEEVKQEVKEEVKFEVKEVNGSSAVEVTKTIKTEEDVDDVDSEDEAALEEALRLAEEVVKKEE
ncbi:uracil DNA glycosylase [Metarhizium acridum]|uniref:Uracil-DNA glycosylase n=1 Tax=Metarhizium acridum (strain CQMa 102) TaxID=655827 RepID=E9EC04_METAQ|nr:uracil-DNA glycosylase [Metarhizium acridum CQMa 102]EFY86540.1 uracil-DNA glycosylase [Metarhizium acridum CQMa 102]KAG8409005.1 uracil DNA glycosylase [Metarhizium acridum]KAG8422350.1 uracil DNA glycosylase [Metarhizium acridum]